MTLAAVLSGFAASLTAAGVPTVTDMRDLSAPGALLEVDRVTIESLAGDSIVSARLILTAQDSGNDTALHQLSGLLDAFLLGGFSEFCSLDSTEPVEVTAATITTPNGRLPALVANVHISASIGR